MYYHRTSLDACVFLPRPSGRRPAEKKSISDISQHIVKEACIWENVLYFKREPVFNNNNPTGSMSKPGGIVNAACVRKKVGIKICTIHEYYGIQVTIKAAYGRLISKK